MPIMKINIYITGTLNCIPSSEWDKTLNKVISTDFSM